MLQQRIGAVRGDFYEKDEMLGNDFSWRTGEQAGGFDEKYREAGSALFAGAWPSGPGEPGARSDQRMGAGLSARSMRYSLASRA